MFSMLSQEKPPFTLGILKAFLPEKRENTVFPTKVK